MDVLWVTEDSELRKQKDDPFHYRKASELGRYLLTHDEDFWNDHGYPLYQCPGLILLATYDTEIAKYLPQLLQKVMDDYSPLDKPLYLDRTKTRLSAEGVTIKMLDHDTQKKCTETRL